MSRARKYVLVGALALVVLAAGSAPAVAGLVTVEILPSNSTINLGQVLTLDVKITALDLGGVAGVDGVTLNFLASDPALNLDPFAPGPLLSGWVDVAAHPPFPARGYSYITFGGGIAGIGTLGTIDVSSGTAGTYTLGFDVTTAGVATEFAGGGSTFTLTTVPGTVEVTPEPASLALLGLGALAVFGRRTAHRR